MSADTMEVQRAELNNLITAATNSTNESFGKVATLIASSIKVYLKSNLNIYQSFLITQAESFTNKIHNARTRLDA